jgi:pimeloyl-ACP methyl ester carboxylesterase
MDYANLPRYSVRVCVLSVALVLVGGRVPPPGPTPAALRAAGAAEVRGVYSRPPQTPLGDQPLQVLVALHGMGGNGQDFAAPLFAQADLHGWLLVAPTIQFGDWTDPAQIAREDPALVAWLSALVAQLTHRTTYPVQPRVLLFGHSRGAQLALRFAEIHPEQVAGVGAESAGTYTLPFAADSATGRELDFPFGVANLASVDGGQRFAARRFAEVPVWIGVGANDNRPADVPHAWDALIGTTRLERARAYTSALRRLGVPVSLNVFSGTDHTLTDDMRAAACEALAQMAVTLR